MKELNKREIAILESYDFNVNNIEELETWTNGGVNMFVLYQEHHKDVLEAFKDTLYCFDIDEEIDLYRQGIDYCNNFTIRESLEDFEDYKERLKNIITALEISAELDNVDVCKSEWANGIMTSVLEKENKQYSGYFTMLVEDMSIDELDILKNFDEVYTYDNIKGARIMIKLIDEMKLNKKIKDFKKEINELKKGYPLYEPFCEIEYQLDIE